MCNNVFFSPTVSVFEQSVFSKILLYPITTKCQINRYSTLWKCSNLCHSFRPIHLYFRKLNSSSYHEIVWWLSVQLVEQLESAAFKWPIDIFAGKAKVNKKWYFPFSFCSNLMRLQKETLDCFSSGVWQSNNWTYRLSAIE